VELAEVEGTTEVVEEMALLEELVLEEIKLEDVLVEKT
jgi:hypothetical protein